MPCLSCHAPDSRTVLLPGMQRDAGTSCSGPTCLAPATLAAGASCPGLHCPLPAVDNGAALHRCYVPSRGRCDGRSSSGGAVRWMQFTDKHQVSPPR